MKLRGEPGVAICHFGDGASSEGDAHESMNLAGVTKAPVIFVVQNNNWAISVAAASSRQRGVIAAQRAAGYGIAGERIDGNDVLAMFAATRRARERAVAGEGATLIEAVTYRLGAHTTADDPDQVRRRGRARGGADPRPASCASGPGSPTRSCGASRAWRPHVVAEIDELIEQADP
jgi:2-oxoisovalerate dehydrogenase E1 component alpha subunit